MWMSPCMCANVTVYICICVCICLCLNLYLRLHLYPCVCLCVRNHTTAVDLPGRASEPGDVLRGRRQVQLALLITSPLLLRITSNTSLHFHLCLRILCNAAIKKRGAKHLNQHIFRLQFGCIRRIRCSRFVVTSALVGLVKETLGRFSCYIMTYGPRTCFDFVFIYGRSTTRRDSQRATFATIAFSFSLALSFCLVFPS